MGALGNAVKTVGNHGNTLQNELFANSVLGLKNAAFRDPDEENASF